MNSSWWKQWLVVAVLAGGGPLRAAEPVAEYLGEARLLGDSRDRSGLTQELIADHPANQFGGISAIEHWQGNQYLLLPDRGFGDGAVAFQTRYHRATIDVDGARDGLIPISIDQTTLLSDSDGCPLVGRESVDSSPARPTRLDPEDLRVVRIPGQPALLAISDEYGPRVDLYGLDGRRVREYSIPDYYQVAIHGTAEQEQVNTRGRQTNSGFEALGLVPDGSALFAVIQAPLLQDGGDEGLYCRILRIDRGTGKTREFAYERESANSVICSLLMIDQERGLILERDGKSGVEAACKQVKWVDFREATETSTIDSLPKEPIQKKSGMVPVESRKLIDLLEYEVIQKDPPKKFEGLAWGPDRQDGRKLLLVSVDNDFSVRNPTRIFAFAIRLP